MKKLFISLALVLLCVAQVNAQSKEVSKALRELTKAKEAAQNPKKAAKADTWISLGNAYIQCYEAPIGGLWTDATAMQAKMILKDHTVLKTDRQEINGVLYTVDSYADKDLYYTQDGLLKGWVIKQPAVADEDVLAAASSAYEKAKELGASPKDLGIAVEGLARKYWSNAMSNYNLGNFKDAAVNFEKSYNALESVNKPDTVALYYAGVTAGLAKDSDMTVSIFSKLKNMGSYFDGDTYAFLAEGFKQKGDLDGAKSILLEGFQKFPSSQGILVALINTYLEADDDPEKILEVIHAAQKNEPTNASLVYTEGNLYKKLKKYDEAIECFRKAGELDPTYVFAPYSEGDTYYTIGLELQEKASLETDDNKYYELNEQLNQVLKKAIEPFERAFSITEDIDIKKACAEYLKNIYFRFRDDSAENMANYDKYSAYLQEHQ